MNESNYMNLELSEYQAKLAIFAFEKAARGRAGQASDHAKE